jgi:adenine-specific DNA-methyltransferase
VNSLLNKPGKNKDMKNKNTGLNVEQLGQVFTLDKTVEQMKSMIRNKGRVLEPSAGDGAFALNLGKRTCIAIEFDTKLAQKNKFLNMDFFDFSTKQKFNTIIGNPPYVRYQDIHPDTKEKLKDYDELFDSRSNLYLFFIYKCIQHLKQGGELIFITPRDFIKATSSMKLNQYIFEQGTITDYIEMGDQKIFVGAAPNTAIWRFEKGNFSRKTNKNLNFSCKNGQLLFTKKEYFVPLSSLAYVKVGAVSGADRIFEHEDGIEFVFSKTQKTGGTKKMLYYQQHPHLKNHKSQLLNRKIKRFSEQNWWEWGRKYYESGNPRIYVNQKTRSQKPFFLSDTNAFDGSILAVFPKKILSKSKLKELKDELNKVDWEELGFVIDGRYIFSQRSLEGIVLPNIFKKFIP